MNFNKHYAQEGQHAFLSASQYHWLNYSDEKLRDRFRTWKATERGTRLHALAAQLIDEGRTSIIFFRQLFWNRRFNHIQ